MVCFPSLGGSGRILFVVAVFSGLMQGELFLWLCRGRCVAKGGRVCVVMCLPLVPFWCPFGALLVMIVCSVGFVFPWFVEGDD